MMPNRMPNLRALAPAALLLLAATSTSAAPRPAELPRLSWHLRALIESPDPARLLPPEADPEIVSVVLEGDPALLRDQAAAAGLPVEATAGDLLQLAVPRDQIAALDAWEGLRAARLPWRASAKTTTEGYDATMGEDWHAQGVQGSGVRIGVLDVGFRKLDDLPAEDTPASVETDFSRGDSDSTEHGTAVLEILHDFAPEADYRLATFSTDVEFCEAIEALVNAEVDLISASIGFDNLWHSDSTSPVTQCADWAVEQGVPYFAAAGNENQRYRVGGLAYDGEDGTIAVGDRWELWAATAVGNASVTFRWSEEMLSAAQDIDLVVYNDDGSECGRSSSTQDGGDGSWPVEIVNAIGCSQWVQVVIYSEGMQADLSGLDGYLYSSFGLDTDSQTQTTDLTLPGDTVGGITVGAYDPGTGEVFDYSSRGPTQDGRLKPDVVAPSGVTTATYRRTPFDGTSAATPHAAGVGALWIDATGQRGSPGRLKAWLMGSTEDLDPPGDDPASGAGALAIGPVPASGCSGCSALSAVALPGLATWLSVIAARRGRRLPRSDAPSQFAR